MKKSLLIIFALFFCFSNIICGQIPTAILVQIVKAEDERRADATLENLLKNPNPKIRERAALAVGRIGNADSIPALVNLLKDSSSEVQVMAMFALGEIESAKATPAILEILSIVNRQEHSLSVRARAVEAAGKISAANPKDMLTPELNKAIFATANFEIVKRGGPDDEIILPSLTAILRARPEGGEEVAAKFLIYSNSRIRSDALNTLARLRSKIVNDQARELLKNDTDPVVRANAARMLGVGEDKTAIDLLLNAATKDADSRVRVSAIRALGSLKEASVADKLLPLIFESNLEVIRSLCKSKKILDELDKKVCSSTKSEYLEIATTLGRLLSNSNHEKAILFLDDLNQFDQYQSPEINIALAKIAPKVFVNQVIELHDKLFNANNWRTSAATYQGLAEIANLPSTSENNDIKAAVRVLLVQRLSAWADLPGKEKADDETALAIPDLLTAFAVFKSNNTSNLLRPMLTSEMDVQIRATVAGILADQTASKENVEALKKGFDAAFIIDKTSNDAQLALLDALFKVDKKESVGTLLIALNSTDYLVRQKAYKLLKTEGLEKDFPGLPTSLENFIAKKKNQVLPYAPVFGTKLGQILNTNADYLRAVSRKNGMVKAILTTSKGAFTINFSPEDAPLTVDNFIKLARLKYFNGVTVHRVVPNFVMQDGDPRGDGNGGPGWEVRCEINMLPYERGAVGMALSGKDTGGSQWFVTHSPQPHLDGGYTVFGKVSETDMKVVDVIVRGDKILSVKIVEGNAPPRGIKKHKK